MKAPAKLPLPPYDLQEAEQNVFRVHGMAPIQVLDEKIVYEPRRIPVRDGGREVAFPLMPSRIGASAMVARTDGVSRTDRVIFTENGNSTSAYEYNPVGGGFSDISGLANSVHLPFLYGETLYLIDTFNDIRSLEGNSAAPTTDNVSTNLKSRLNDLSITTAPSQALEWQQRLWLVYGGTVVWSDVANIAEFQPSREVNGTQVNTLAGSQDFGHNITGLEANDDELYVFLDSGQISRIRVLDANIQFGFIPLSTSIDFAGGAIATYRGLFFLTEDGIHVISEDSVRRVSWALGNRLVNLSPTRTYSVVFDRDTIFWAVSGFDEIIAHDINRGFSYFVAEDVDYLVELPLGGTQIDSITAPIDSITDSFDSFGRPNTFTIHALSDSMTDGMGQITPLTQPAPCRIQLNLFKQGRYKRQHISHISVPQVEEYDLRWKDPSVNAWNGPFAPDRFGVVQVQEVFNGMDLEICLNVPQRVGDVEVLWKEVSR